MAVYSVSSEIFQPNLRAAIERSYPEKHYHWSQTTSFVRTGDAPGVVVKNLGVQDRASDGSIIPGIQQTAIVQLAPSYDGWTSASLWSWLKDAFEAAD